MAMLTEDGIDVYDIGDPVTMTATYRNTAGNLADPTTVAFHYTSPDGVGHVGASIIHVSTGVYSLLISPDQYGIWRWSSTGTGSVAQAEETLFYVRRPFTALDV